MGAIYQKSKQIKIKWFYLLWLIVKFYFNKNGPIDYGNFKFSVMFNQMVCPTALDMEYGNFKFSVMLDQMVCPIALDMKFGRVLLF